MWKATSEYLNFLGQQTAQGWNRFWFTPCSPLRLAVLRVLVGVVSLYYVATFWPDLVRWFGPQGWLVAPQGESTLAAPDPVGQWLQVRFPIGEQLWGFDDAPTGALPPLYRLSYLTYLRTPWELHTAQALGVLVLVLFALGWKVRWTAPAALVVVLSYVHRAPMLNAQLEPVLAMLMFYLALSPCGAAWSLDWWFKRRRAKHASALQVLPSWKATVPMRLIQVHLTGWYALTLLAQLSGGTSGPVWWTGEAMWWVVARPDSTLLSADFLARHPLLIDLWTYFVVVFQGAFVVLIWVRPFRPLMLAGAVVYWLGVILSTGLVSYGLLMLAALVVFVPVEQMRTRALPEEAPTFG